MALRPLRTHFSDAFTKVDALREAMIQTQDELALHRNDTNLQLIEKSIREDFIHWNKAALSFMSQRSKENWIL